MMAVSDEQVAALRAFLTLQPDEAERLTEQLAAVGALDGYGALVYAAFVTAIRRRFSPTWTIPYVIRFVATARARLLKNEIEIDPRAAEILMRRALGDSIVAELDEEARTRAQIFLLGEMVVDEQLDDAGLDAFLATARVLADQLAE
jgi:hypothetical protein